VLHRWLQLGVRPYVTLDNRIDGTVVTALDIDAVKKGERVLAEARTYDRAPGGGRLEIVSGAGAGARVSHSGPLGPATSTSPPPVRIAAAEPESR
jgi:hypothetical protein